MKTVHKSAGWTAVLIAFFILLNFTGKTLASHYNLPLWLDAVGTVFAAYIFGPICGAIVGLTGNLLYEILFSGSVVYGITSIMIGITVGIFAQKGKMETFFDSMVLATIVTVLSMFVSLPLNFIFYSGQTGNVWGDAAIEFLEVQGFSFMRYVVGEFYLDFVDKVITLFLLFLAIHTCRWLKRSFSFRKPFSKTLLFFLVAMLGIMGGFSLKPLSAYAYNGSKEEMEGKIDYSSYIRTVYDRQNGLPCGVANDVKQTADGIIWVGTYAGLYRYNGREFQWMNEYESVRNVNCLYMDEEGRMWIGTNDSGISICINEKVVNVIDTQSGLPANSVHCICRDAGGNYYVGTTAGMAIFSLNNGLHLIKVFPEITNAQSISINGDGYVAVVGTDNTLFLLHSQEIISTSELEEAGESYISTVFDSDGRLYAGTSGNTVYVYEIMDSQPVYREKFSCGELRNINSMYYDEKQGNIFLCTDNGLAFLDAEKKLVKINTGEFNNSVENMEIDYQGNLWFTSSRLGLLQLSKSVITDIFQSAELGERVVNTVEEWKGELYIGTDAGLCIIDLDAMQPVENEYTAYFENDRIRCIRKDSDENLWVCTHGRGAVKIGKDGEIVSYDINSGLFGNKVRVVTQLSDENILLAGNGGFSIVSKSGEIDESVEFPAGNAQVLCVLETSDHRLLLGTDGDGIRIVSRDQEERRLDMGDGLSSAVVLRMFESPEKGIVYIVTSNGLCRMDEQENIITVDNFPYYNNYEIWRAEDGTLFVPGSAGIYVVEENELLTGTKSLSYELLGAEWGLTASITANAWNYMDEKGNLYLASSVGVFKINTRNYSINNRSYRMSVSAVKLDNELCKPERSHPLKIGKDVEKISIFPEIINYTVEDPFVSYMLEGFDSSRTVLRLSDLGELTYTNLPSGTYVFHLAVLDKERKNVLEESKYTFVKENAFYDSYPFRIYMYFVALLAVAWFTWLIGRTQIQKTLKLQKQQLEFANQQVKMSNETILTIAKTLDARDENTSQHSERVSEYSVLIAKELGLSEEQCENLRKAALLHDIGKIGIPDNILNKPAGLTDEEYGVMKSHVTKGAEILKNVTAIDHVIEGALYHHERYDGRGYMHGLKGEDIPLYGRIIGVADAFDAMTANRVYRKKLDLDYVMGELERGKGTQFDPDLAEIMLRLIREGKIDVKQLYGETENKDAGEGKDLDEK